MNKLTVLFMLLIITHPILGQFKKNGTPDMRFKENKEQYSSSPQLQTYTPVYQGTTYEPRLKKDGTPDMRFKENKEQYGSSPQLQTYTPVYQGTTYEPHLKKDGTSDMRFKENKSSYHWTPDSHISNVKYPKSHKRITSGVYSHNYNPNSRKGISINAKNQEKSVNHNRVANRPIYSGSSHTTSHGGKYSGATNNHHKGGHYVNPRTNNHYGIHKKK